MHQRRGALASVWGGGLLPPALCCREQGEVPSGWTQHPGPQLVAQFPRATCYPQVWGSHCRQHPHARVSLELCHTPPEREGTQAEEPTGEEAGGPPKPGPEDPQPTPGTRPLQRQRPSLFTLMLARAGPPQLQPSWSSPEPPHSSPTQPINWADLPTGDHSSPRACCPALLGSSGSRLCLSLPNGSTR